MTGYSRDVNSKNMLIRLQLLREFDFDVVNAEKPWSSKNFNIWMQHEFYVRATERDGSRVQ
jgi:hypothetical protein